MICSACRYAGDIRKLAALDGLGEEIPAGRTAELHAKCPGGTWCDCQHVLPVRPGSGDSDAPTLNK